MLYELLGRELPPVVTRVKDAEVFERCSNGDRVSQCYHWPRCRKVIGHGFGRMVPAAPGDEAAKR